MMSDSTAAPREAGQPEIRLESVVPGSWWSRVDPDQRQSWGEGDDVVPCHSEAGHAIIGELEGIIEDNIKAVMEEAAQSLIERIRAEWERAKTAKRVVVGATGSIYIDVSFLGDLWRKVSRSVSATKISSKTWYNLCALGLRQAAMKAASLGYDTALSTMIAYLETPSMMIEAIRFNQEGQIVCGTNLQTGRRLTKEEVNAQFVRFSNMVMGHNPDKVGYYMTVEGLPSRRTRASGLDEEASVDGASSFTQRQESPLTSVDSSQDESGDVHETGMRRGR